MTEKESPERDDERGEGIARRIVDAARDAASEVVEAASGVAQAASDVVEAASAATNRIRPREGRLARERRLRRLNRTPLPNLHDLHPEARLAARRDLGLLTIPVSEIRGTAVAGPAQRGGDFLPFPVLKSTNWENRWQRLRQAQDSLAILPPIDVLQTSEGYWVTDGHNRVAAALYGGQDDIDASVTHLHLPNADDAEIRIGSLTTQLEDSMQVRAAAAGRLSRGATARGRTPPAAQAPAAPETALPRDAARSPKSSEGE